MIAHLVEVFCILLDLPNSHIMQNPNEYRNLLFIYDFIEFPYFPRWDPLLCLVLGDLCRSMNMLVSFASVPFRAGSTNSFCGSLLASMKGDAVWKT